MTPRMATLWYRTPEMMTGQQTYGSPSGVWSFRITRVEMEQGHPPFREGSGFPLLSNISSTA
eukprot:4821772-Lingulodinium_polyedra.AAC.1